MLWPVTVSSSCRWIWRRSSNLRPLGTIPESNPQWNPYLLSLLNACRYFLKDFHRSRSWYHHRLFLSGWMFLLPMNRSLIKGQQQTQMTVFYSVVLKRAQSRCTCSLLYLGKRLKQNMLILASKYKKPPFLSTKRSCQAIPGLILMLWLSLWHCCQLKVPVYVDLFRPLLRVTGANQTRALGTSRRPLLFVQWA